MEIFSKAMVIVILSLTIGLACSSMVDYSKGLKETIQARINNRINILSLNN